MYIFVRRSLKSFPSVQLKINIKHFFTAYLLLIAFNAFTQSDTLNQHDEKKKKNGWWIVYLNKNWKQVKDTSQALYFRFNFFDHGANVYPMGTSGKSSWKLEAENTDADNDGARIKRLDGVYKWYDSKGILHSEHIFKEGQYVSCKEYFNSGLVSQHFDYSKKCKRQIHGWCVSVFDQKGKLLQESCMCKNKSGMWILNR